MQNSINLAIVAFNNASDKAISTVDFISSLKPDFIADIKVVAGQLGSKGNNVEAYAKELNEIKKLLKHFLDGIGELDIHIISGAFVCPSLLSLRPSVDFFKVWDINIETYTNSQSTANITTKARSVSSYTDFMTSSQYLAAYYKVCYRIVQSVTSK